VWRRESPTAASGRDRLPLVCRGVATSAMQVPAGGVQAGEARLLRPRESAVPRAGAKHGSTASRGRIARPGRAWGG